MRLKQVKLAGFKSFVDPTKVNFPSNLAAIVGPNGCGKSNIIDAIRWVMGESSPKQLRGQDMGDFMFNGSATRKPVGQASVELIFDNSDHTIGGQYAHYHEIAIRRQITRDAQSQYFLNGTKCRRRDIIDIFLGTGLGPRSYAIISQGTISRLIEAKPEELRVYLEEAAGISKYKERRRETENRIRHTRENLDRLNDLREELEKQLNHLQRQANAAERYKTLKQEERLYKAQLLALRWKQLHDQIKTLQNAINEQEVALEAAIAKQRELDATIENHRQQRIDANEHCNQIQKQFYDLGNEVTRLEQNITYLQERRTQYQADAEQAEMAWQELQQTINSDQGLSEELQQQLMTLDPEVIQANTQAEQSNEKLTAAQQALTDWQTQWDEFNHTAAQTSQQAEIEKTRIHQLEQRILNSQQRIDAITQELSTLDADALAKDINELTQHHQQITAEQQTAADQLAECIEKIQAQRDINQQHNTELRDAERKLQQQQGELTALEALQQIALGKNNEVVVEWLQQHELDSHPRLAQNLQVAAGWEQAVEVILNHDIQAVCVDNIADLANDLQVIDSGTLTVVDQHVETPHSIVSNHDLPLLVDKIQASRPLQGLFAYVYTAESLTQALAVYRSLAPHESIITKDGVWLGANWIKISRSQDDYSGVLEREHELQTIKQHIEKLTVEVDELQTARKHDEERLFALEEERDEQITLVNQYRVKTSDTQAQLQVKQERADQIQQRIATLSQELKEHQQTLNDLEQELTQARDHWQAALTEMQQHATVREELSAQKQTVTQELVIIREQALADKDTAHAVALKVQGLRTQLDATRQNSQRLEQQVNNLQQRRQQLAESLAKADEPIEELKVSLEQQLNQRLQVETTLTAARNKLDAIEEQLRDHDKSRQEIIQAIDEQRDGVQQKRLQWQGLQVRRTTIQEQLQEAGHELQTIVDELPQEADEKTWEQQLEQITNRIQRLGAINLAAIDEYKTQAERKVYLDKQHDDLIEALTTLENAIAKIDRETRARFKETYDTVNESFKTLFPQVFGGGSAYLELTGDDLLSTGVTVMAKPPGKRNSTIHLLSGGEKAMTAISLVFAIFQLNPAPFCMLDEVDAPLDDANITRYCNLVKEMSNKIQFIFISHNKLAIEMAQHLLGVTMHEPGVSRLVAVDVEEAVALAGA